MAYHSIHRLTQSAVNSSMLTIEYWLAHNLLYQQHTYTPVDKNEQYWETRCQNIQQRSPKSVGAPPKVQKMQFIVSRETGNGKRLRDGMCSCIELSMVHGFVTILTVGMALVVMQLSHTHSAESSRSAGRRPPCSYQCTP